MCVCLLIIDLFSNDAIERICSFKSQDEQAVAGKLGAILSFVATPALNFMSLDAVMVPLLLRYPHHTFSSYLRLPRPRPLDM